MLAVLDPRVGHTVGVLSPFIFVPVPVILIDNNVVFQMRRYFSAI